LERAEIMPGQEKANRTAYRFYLHGMTSLGLGVVLFCLYNVLASNIGHQWLYLASLTVLTGAFTVKIPGIDSKISVADTFVFTNLILFGPAAGALTASLDAFMSSLRFSSQSKKLEYTIFNMAVMALTAFTSGHLFFLVLGRGPLYQGEPEGLWPIIVPVCALGLIHYVINSGSVAAIVALERHKNIFHVWRESFLWTSLTYLAGALFAGLIAVNAKSLTPTIVGMILLMVLVIYFTYKTYLDKVAEHFRHLKEVNQLYSRTVESLALAVDAKDQTTYGHIRRVRAYALGLAHICGITDAKVLMAIETGSLLHDIGKLAIEDYILNKPARLTRQEFERMKAHSAAGDEILRQIQFPFPVAEYVRYHHERYDGTGYPDGLKGDEIPLGARILSIADTFDAIRSSRPYKKARSIEETIEIMQAESAKIYDPQLLEMFIANIAELETDALEASKNAPQLSFRKFPHELAQPAAGPGAASGEGDLQTGMMGELISLQEFSHSLGRNLDLEDLLMNLERRIGRLLPFTTCLFYLHNGDHTLRVARSTGKFAEPLRGFSVAIGKGISGWVAAYRQPMINASPGLEFGDLDARYGCLNDALVVPLMAGNHCLGTISLFADAPRSYSPAHLHLLHFFADLTAPLIGETQQRLAKVQDRDLADTATHLPRAPYLALIGPPAIAASAASGSPLSALCLDFDNLSDLGALYGFDACDFILRQIAQRLRAQLREGDTLVRYGYQAFIVLLPAARKDQALILADYLIKTLRTAPDPAFSGWQSRLNCLAGAASYPEDGLTILELIQCAQQAAATSVPCLTDGAVAATSQVAAIR
jgi:diguanylate cyclase (GGDEF)-like protein/putative nucleotidyltransferase with HDIG domain